MEGFEQPDDLADLERRLADRQRPEPGPSFRDRLLAAVHQELQKGSGLPGRHLGWQFAAAVAAAVVLWANFSMSIVNDMDWRLAGDPESVDTRALSAELHKFFPEMSEQEIARQAFVVRGGSPLPALVDPKLADYFEQTMNQRQDGAWK